MRIPHHKYRIRFYFDKEVRLWSAIENMMIDAWAEDSKGMDFIILKLLKGIRK